MSWSKGSPRTVTFPGVVPKLEQLPGRVAGSARSSASTPSKCWPTCCELTNDEIASTPGEKGGVSR